MPSNPFHFCAILVQSLKTQKNPADADKYSCDTERILFLQIF